MDITEATLLHHVGIVLVMLWLLSLFNRCHLIFYFLSLIYLFLVHERYVIKLRKKLQYEEKKQAHQKRMLSDSETVRWLNYAVEKIWLVCMEQIASQKILLPIIPWFLEKYKPWTAKKALVQHMYLGRNPPLFTEVRVLRHSTGDDHLVLELGMNFCTADDMSAILAVKLRKRLGFGMWTKLHITGMQIEGKILVGVKFLRSWPFLGRVRVCFAEPPYFQMTVKPIFTHGLNVTEVPGIAGWLDKLLSIAFEQTLVQPNMLVVDVEKFASPGQAEDWFCVDEKEPVAVARVEVIEASDMKPSDLNGLADPYVKGQLGPYRFRTKIQKKNLFPKWHEEFKIPITTWDSANMLAFEVRDKDRIYDDTLGDCSVNINDLKDGERHDLWLPLENIKMGRLHLAITVLEKSAEGIDTKSYEGETWEKEEVRDAVSSEAANNVPVPSPKVADKLEPINIEGQDKTGIWVHHPGSEVSQIWEPRKGKSRFLDSQVRGAPGDSVSSTNLTASGSPGDDSSSTDEGAEGKKRRNKVQRGLHKLGSMFHRRPKKEDDFINIGDLKSPYANVRAVNQKGIGVKLIVDDALSGPNSVKDIKEVHLNSQGNGTESLDKGNVKGMANSILKQARSIKHTLSRKGSDKTGSSGTTDGDIGLESDSSDDESLASPQVQRIPVPSSPIISLASDGSFKTKTHNAFTRSTEVVAETNVPVKKVNAEGLDRIAENEIATFKKSDAGVEESAESELAEGNLNKVK